MEGVEEANRAAVGSCKELVARLSQSGDPFRLTAVAAETDDAVSRFDKVVTILSNRFGHARARLGKRSSPPVDASCLLDHPLVPCPSPKGFHGSSTPAPPPPPRPQARSSAAPSMQEKETVVPVVVAVAPCAAGKVIAPAAKVDRNMFLETPLLDLNGCSVPSSMVAMQNSSKVVAGPAVNHPSCTTQIQFQHHHHHHHQQQQQQQKEKKKFQFDQKPRENFHIEMAPRISSAKEPEVITFSFDNSVCTSSAATTSFFTSISSQLISMSDAATNSAAAAPSKKAAHGARKAEDADGKCHCPKKKKQREKRVVRMPAISDKVADIPEDNYSWRKYGQKPIKGSPHPRGYYRCSIMKDCPARKHVERCRSDPGMMIVTYENEHNHTQPLDLSMLAANSEA